MRVSSVSSFKQLTRKKLNKNNFNDLPIGVYISAKTQILNKNLILGQERAQNIILCDSFTGISNTRYRRMVKSDFQLDDFLVDADPIFFKNKLFAMTTIDSLDKVMGIIWLMPISTISYRALEFWFSSQSLRLRLQERVLLTILFSSN